MGSVPAIMIRVIAAEQLRVTAPERAPVGIHPQRQRAERGAVLAGERTSVGAGLAGGARLGHALSEARTDGVERIGKIGPAGRRRAGRGGAGEGARLPLPASKGPLRVVNFLGAHAPEEIILGVERADMVEAQPAPLRRAVGGIADAVGRCAELAGRGAALDGAAARLRPRNPPVEPFVAPR